jgi:hypothetical protein
MSVKDIKFMKKSYGVHLTILLAFLSQLTISRSIDIDTLYDQSTTQLYDELYNTTMEWGTYKPNLFFGIKNREAFPINIGLAWAVPDPRKNAMSVRHTYKYESGDGVTAYYEFHDGWSSSK